MANPVVVPCPADAWTAVATNTFSGTVKVLNFDPSAYYETYRVTGDPAPTDLSDAFIFESILEISDGSGIDVYIQPKGNAGVVRVDS